jgi:hypothetical protein
MYDSFLVSFDFFPIFILSASKLGRPVNNATESFMRFCYDSEHFIGGRDFSKRLVALESDSHSCASFTLPFSHRKKSKVPRVGGEPLELDISKEWQRRFRCFSIPT